MSSHSFRFDPELAWPWSLKPYGAWALGIVALFLVVLTVWTYMGVKGATVRRVLTVLALRLAALALACIMVVRPSIAVREMTYLPAQLLVLYDRSESMTIADEYDSKTRWEAMIRLKDEHKGRFEDLERKNVAITEHHFDGDLRPYDPQAQPDGTRTDFGQTLNSLYKQHLADKNLLAVLIVSDGTETSSQFPAKTEAERLRKLGCKVYTVGLGKPTNFERSRDLAFTELTVSPSPVPVKGKMSVHGVLDAPGFENAKVTLRLKIDGKQVLAREETLRNNAANDIDMVVDAPATPGEVLVTLSVDPLVGEATTANNVISTYATISKEGISVLLVDRLRLEQKFIRHALETDPRFRLFVSWRVNDMAPAGVDLFQFDQRQYDVIILGDLTPNLLAAGDPTALDKIAELVRDKGVGLLMMGGRDSFGNSDWARSPLGKLLPVEADERGQNDAMVRMEPTPKGLEKALMRLKEPPAANRELWDKQLPELNGMTPLGKLRGNATPFAVKAGTDEPILAYMQAGEGRVLAFAGDTTWRWLRLGQPKKSDGVDAHARFWRQLVLFLAKQDEVDGNAWIKPETRRLPAGSGLKFTVGLRGKDGVNDKDARFEVKVRNPKDVEVPVDVVYEDEAHRGTFWKTEVPGEYRIELNARGKDGEVKKATARFIVFQDAAEMARRAAGHDFLDELARNGGGKFFPGQKFGDFFDELDRQSLERSAVKTERWPDWDKEGTLSSRRIELSWFLLGIFLAFVSLLCTEWLLRRRWGLV